MRNAAASTVAAPGQCVIRLSFLLQLEKRLPNRRARDRQTHTDFGFYEAIVGHQAELGDVAFELCVNVCRARWMNHHSVNKGWHGGRLHKLKLS